MGRKLNEESPMLAAILIHQLGTFGAKIVFVLVLGILHDHLERHSSEPLWNLVVIGP